MSFGCNTETAEDVVQEMYIKINSTLLKGTNIMFNENEINHFYIFRTLRTMFLDLIRKEKNIILWDIEKVKLPPASPDINYNKEYEKFLNNLDGFHWYEKKVFEYIENGESIAGLSKKTKISYYSLYNTYKRVKQSLLDKI